MIKLVFHSWWMMLYSIVLKDDAAKCKLWPVISFWPQAPFVYFIKAEVSFLQESFRPCGLHLTFVSV